MAYAITLVVPMAAEMLSHCRRIPAMVEERLKATMEMRRGFVSVKDPIPDISDIPKWTR